jgi:hypothetical protein
VHAATERGCRQAEKITRPASQQEAALKKAYDDLTAVSSTRREETAGARKQYGMTDLHEFVAELHSNDRSATFLMAKGHAAARVGRDAPAAGAWAPTTEAAAARARCERAFFSNERINQTFDASPDGAARATDVTLQRAREDRPQGRVASPAACRSPS